MPASEALTDEEHARWWRERGFAELRQLLFWRWDPIGVDDAFPATEDEYDSYVPDVLSLLREEATAEGIADYLAGIERDAMGLLPTDAATLRALGQRLLHWYEESTAYWIHRARRPT